MNGECDGQLPTFYGQGLILDINLGPKPLLNITGQVCCHNTVGFTPPGGGGSTSGSLGGGVPPRPSNPDPV